MKKILIIHFAAFLLASQALGKVKTVVSSKDQIIPVNVALGIATIVEIPEAITSAVIGDQGSFKVEYLDHSITVKPLRFGARTNLYLMGQKVRYAFRVVTTSQDQADYIVYIKAKDDRAGLVWSRLAQTRSLGDTTVTWKRKALTQDGFMIFDGILECKKHVAITPDDVWVLQAGKSVLIESLFLSSLVCSVSDPVKIALAVDKSQMNSRDPLVMQLRTPRPFSLPLPMGTVKK